MLLRRYLRQGNALLKHFGLELAELSFDLSHLSDLLVEGPRCNLEGRLCLENPGLSTLDFLCKAFGLLLSARQDLLERFDLLLRWMRLCNGHPALLGSVLHMCKVLLGDTGLSGLADPDHFVHQLELLLRQHSHLGLCLLRNM